MNSGIPPLLVQIIVTGSNRRKLCTLALKYHIATGRKVEVGREVRWPAFEAGVDDAVGRPLQQAVGTLRAANITAP